MLKKSVEKLVRRHPMIFLCLFQFCSLFFKKYNASFQVWPAARPPRPCGLVAAAVLSESRLWRGSMGGHILKWTALVHSAAGVGSPGLCAGHLGSAMGWAAHSDQQLWHHSCPMLCRAFVAWAACWSCCCVSTQQMTSLDKKEETYLFSVRRDPVFLWVWGCTSAMRPQSVARPPRSGWQCWWGSQRRCTGPRCVLVSDGERVGCRSHHICLVTAACAIQKWMWPVWPSTKMRIPHPNRNRLCKC